MGVRLSGRAKRPLFASIALAVLGATLIGSPEAGAAFDGENGRIFFESGRSIFSVSQNGGPGTVKPVVKSGALPGKPVVNDPAISPSGRKIAFSIGKAIWIGTIGGGAHQVTNNAADRHNLSGFRFPGWSPNGRKLVFQATRKKNGVFTARIYRINVDGTGILELRKLPGFFGSYETHPDWSETGKIAFSADDDLWIMNPNGSGRVNLTGDFGNYEEPSWSPDGEMIAVVHEASGGPSDTPGIVALDADTGEIDTMVTGNGVTGAPSKDYGSPSWSPDGEFIAFAGYINGEEEEFNPDVYKRASDGTGDFIRVQTHNGGKESRYPVWGVKP